MAAALLPLLCFSSLAHGAIEIKAKAVKTSSTDDQELWVIRIELNNATNASAGPLTLQYRYSGYSEFGPDGKPEGALKHKENKLKSGILKANEKATVDTPEMKFAGERDQRKLAKGMFQDIRVRAWQNGKLVGEFAEKGGKTADSDWPLSPPPVEPGGEVGSGPWLLIANGRAEFSGIALGAPAAQVLTMLKSQGSAKPEAKPQPFLTHPFRMTTADLPGCTFAFDAVKKLSAIEVTDAAHAKLPGGLVLGKSTLADYAKSFGNSEPVDPAPTGSTTASRFKLGTATLTIRDSADAPGVAAAILIE